MALNFNLLRQEGPQGIYQGFMQGQEAAAQNALAQEKAAQEKELNALRVQQLRGTIGEQETARQKQSRVEKASAFRERMLRAPTPEVARELVKMQYADPDLGPVLAQSGTLEQSLAEVSDDPRLFERYKQQEALGMAKWMESQMPKVAGNAVYLPGENRFVTPPPQPKEITPPSMVAEYQFAQTPAGGGFKGSYQEFVVQREAAKRPPPQPVQPSAPVVVVGPDGKQIYVSREEALRGRMTPAAAMEGLTPKEVQKREAVLPQARASVTSFETKTDNFIKELESLRDDSGLDQITGSIYGRTPSASRSGSRAQATYNKIFAKGGFQGLQDLREASKTGGALGNVSNEEGRRLEASVVGGLDRTQNIEDVKAGINALIEELKVSKARVRNTFEDTYSYKTSTPTKPTGSWEVVR